LKHNGSGSLIRAAKVGAITAWLRAWLLPLFTECIRYADTRILGYFYTQCS